MNRSLAICILVAFSVVGISQEKISVNVEKVRFNLLEELSLPDQFLDSIFQTGKVIFKDGRSSSAYLNYNLVSNSIFFVDNQKRALMLADLPNISVVSYGNRTFMPVGGDEVAEVVETFANGASLLLKRKATIKNSHQNRGPYGASTETSSVDRITAIHDGGTFKHIDTEVRVDVTLSSQYIVFMQGEKFPIRMFKDLKKVYPTKWDEIKMFAEDNDLDLAEKSDIVRLLRHCNN